MQQNELEAIVSSGARLKIASLLSVRPRTLRELSALTGVSVQAVLKHLGKLDSLGMLSEESVQAGSLGVRKVYALKGYSLADYSSEGLLMVRVSKRPAVARSDPSLGVLKSLAQETLFQRQRIREQARRLVRMVDELSESEEKLNSIVDEMKLADAERLILRTVYTEETLEDAESALRRNYGLPDPRRAIESLLSKVERIA
ncbi:MAG TPA: ArsR family transcriptional regulator [Nitrososphaerales archaeon]|nr:ArsR family transcriptional regulator [Nitrososphaerales archaeon]